MGPIRKKAVFLALFASAACASKGTNERVEASNAGTNATVAADAAVQPPVSSAKANEAAEGEDPVGTPAAASILAWSTPAAGSTVSAPVKELVFHFTPPARLGEVIVSGPDGAMPMMVTAVGDVEHYSLPVDGLGSGSYRVAWRASASGVDYRGSFGFQVR